MQFTADPCLFSKCNSKTGNIIWLAVYVDDIVVAHNSSKLLDWFKAGFKEKFKSNHLGPLSWFWALVLTDTQMGP
jgi:hypothetical protein